MKNFKDLSDGFKTFHQNIQKVIARRKVKKIMDLSELQKFKVMVTKKMK